MSACASASKRASHGVVRPPISAASASPRSCRRVAIVVLATCSWKCTADRRAISPAPNTTTCWWRMSPKIFRASVSDA